MAEPFSAESRLIHAGTERVPGQPEDGYYGGRVLADRLRPRSTRPVPVDLRDLAAVERALAIARYLAGHPRMAAADLITDIDQALEVL